MIGANPGNPLLLGNYARFLKEVTYYFQLSFVFRGLAVVPWLRPAAEDLLSRPLLVDR